VDVNAQASYGHNLDKISTYDYNPATGEYDSFLLEKSNNLARDKWMQGINPGLNIELKKDINLRMHFNTQFQQVNNAFGRGAADLDQHFVFFMPNINFNMKGFSVDYSRYTFLPNIGDMVPYTVVFSPSYSVTGNPLLETYQQQFLSVSIIPNTIFKPHQLQCAGIGCVLPEQRFQAAHAGCPIGRNQYAHQPRRPV
jgi:hypothetical protein